jgi:hypothetical protein
MSEYTPDDILRMAQERIAARKVATRRSLPWGAIFLGSFSAWGCLWSRPAGMPLEWKMYAVVHGICAQQHNILSADYNFHSALETAVFT